MSDRTADSVGSNGWPFAEALFTDLYELSMLQAYDAEGMDRPAVFELLFRELPPERRYAVAAGLSDVVDYLEAVRFTEDDLGYLDDTGRFSNGFLKRLENWRFSGEVHAVAEGTIVWPDEPVAQITAPIGEAQLVETLVLNQVHFQSVAAAKAARIVDAARGRPVVDFGSRRAHGTDAAMKVARASYLVGAAGTSNLLAGKRYDIPIFGTMAHSYIEAHDREAEAFERFAALNPQTTLLVDTYDTMAGIDAVIALARRQGERFDVRAVRLDSGDLTDLAAQARRRLDQAGLTDVKIFASSGLDEYKIDQILEADAPIDGFGVGTRLGVSEDAPTLDFAYKLVAYDQKPRLKLSSSKRILPGPKQVFRELRGGVHHRDTVARAEESLAGEPLLQPIMRDGQRLPNVDLSLAAARDHHRKQREMLPPTFREIDPQDVEPPVVISAELERLFETLRADLLAERRA